MSCEQPFGDRSHSDEIGHLVPAAGDVTKGIEQRTPLATVDRTVADPSLHGTDQFDTRPRPGDDPVIVGQPLPNSWRRWLSDHQRHHCGRVPVAHRFSDSIDAVGGECLGQTALDADRRPIEHSRRSAVPRAHDPSSDELISMTRIRVVILVSCGHANEAGDRPTAVEDLHLATASDESQILGQAGLQLGDRHHRHLTILVVDCSPDKSPCRASPGGASPDRRRARRAPNRLGRIVTGRSDRPDLDHSIARRRIVPAVVGVDEGSDDARQTRVVASGVAGELARLPATLPRRRSATAADPRLRRRRARSRRGRGSGHRPACTPGDRDACRPPPTAPRALCARRAATRSPAAVACYELQRGGESRTSWERLGGPLSGRSGRRNLLQRVA